LFIAFCGLTQTWVFSNVVTGAQKPFLYDLLKPIPFWPIWMILLLPLHILSNIIVALDGYGADFIMRGPFWLFLLIQIIYFYILSCTVFYIWGKLSELLNLKIRIISMINNIGVH
jgi:hypothetical protein